MSKELTITLRITANEGEAVRAALRYATRPSLTDEWTDSKKERRAAENALSKVAEAMDKWERRPD